ISVLLAMVAPSLSGFGAGREAEYAGAQLMSVAHWAREQAISEGRVYRLNFNRSRQSYQVRAQVGGVFQTAQVGSGLQARAGRGGLRWVGVLATIVMMAIVRPAAMQGISLCLGAARDARQRSEAAALAEAKLAQLVATGEWQYGGTSGDFGDAWPEYRWTTD